MFYKGKKVLVTGGSGFVGTHIVAELLSQDAKVRVPIHKRPLIIKDSRIETISADLNKQEDCLKILDGIDYVFHAAGAVAAASATKTNPMSAITTNLVLTAQMLQAAWTAGTERFLIFSSSTGYPPADYPIKEEEMWSGPPHPVYFGYGWMRRYLEKMAEFVSSKSKVKIALVRPTAVYGPWDNFDPVTSHVIPGLIQRAVKKENPFIIWGDGSEVRDFLHIKDLARGCLLMLEKYSTCDPINIGYGKAITIKEAVNIILNAAGHNNAEIVFDNSKPTTIPVRMVDTSKAKKILNFSPEIDIEKGIKETVSWCKEYMQILQKNKNSID